MSGRFRCWDGLGQAAGSTAKARRSEAIRRRGRRPSPAPRRSRRPYRAHITAGSALPGGHPKVHHVSWHYVEYEPRRRNHASDLHTRRSHLGHVPHRRDPSRRPHHADSYDLRHRSQCGDRHVRGKPRRPRIRPALGAIGASGLRREPDRDLLHRKQDRRRVEQDLQAHEERRRLDRGQALLRAPRHRRPGPGGSVRQQPHGRQHRRRLIHHAAVRQERPHRTGAREQRPQPH